ncbi:MAG: hypothetical protein KC493_04500 [Bacteriovoracaceae bacterium]|nr:hypothetical protein [Bacteriovoracaceae bacterium]
MNKDELDKILIESSKKSEKVIIWNFSLGSFHFIEYSFKTIRRDRNEIIFSPSGGMSVEMIKSVISGSGILNVLLTDSGIFLKTHFSSIDDAFNITTTLPELSFRDERRKGERFLIDDIDLKIVRNEKEEVAKLGDISEGGASLYIIKKVSGIPKVEEKLTSIKLQAGGEVEIGEAKVLFVQKIPPYQEIFPYSVWKISVEFDKPFAELVKLKELG